MEVTKADVDAGRAASGQYMKLSSRDCLHLAIMRRLGCTKVWTFDRGFEEVPSLQRIS